MTYQFPEIVLVEFPFTDLIQFKTRPALLILSGSHDDFVVVRISSSTELSTFDFLLRDTLSAGLAKASKIQLDKIITVNRTKIKGTIGKLSEVDAKIFSETFLKTYSFSINPS